MVSLVIFIVYCYCRNQLWSILSAISIIHHIQYLLRRLLHFLRLRRYSQVVSLFTGLMDDTMRGGHYRDNLSTKDICFNVPNVHFPYR